jgi:hypothetical protein
MLWSDTPPHTIRPEKSTTPGNPTHRERRERRERVRWATSWTPLSSRCSFRGARSTDRRGWSRRRITSAIPTAFLRCGCSEWRCPRHCGGRGSPLLERKGPSSPATSPSASLSVARADGAQRGLWRWRGWVWTRRSRTSTAERTGRRRWETGRRGRKTGRGISAQRHGRTGVSDRGVPRDRLSSVWTAKRRQGAPGGRGWPLCLWASKRQATGIPLLRGHSKGTTATGAALWWITAWATWPR